MRLLFVGINYAPETSGNAPYTTGLAEHLAGLGHDIHILTGQPHYPGWQRLHHQDITGLVNGVTVYRRWHYIPRSHSALRRAMYEASFIGTGSLLMGIPQPDAIVGIIPSLGGGLIARLAASRFDRPYGLLFQDLMGQAAGQSGLAGGSKVEGLVRRTEGWIARGAERVAMVTEGFRPYLESIGVAPEALHRVRNWTHVPPVSETAGPVRARYGWRDEEIVCLHAGNMGYKQGLDNVIETARLARERAPHVRFVLMGDGNLSHALRTSAASYGLTNIQFLPPQDDANYVNTLAAADMLLLSLSPRITDMAFPSKVGSYVASGRPVIASVSPLSEIGKELKDHSAALLIEPGNPEHLLEGITRLAADDLLRYRLTKAAQEYGRLFAKEAALAELERFVLRVAGREPAGATAEERELTEVA